MAPRFQARLSRASTALDAVATAAADDCFWLYSSGSTGRPKGAVHRHLDIVVTCAHYAVDTLGMREDDVCFSAAKLFFAYGLGNAMTFPLWVGATAVLSDQRPTPQMTFDLIERFKPTLYFGVPTLYAAQLRELEQTPRDVSSLRLCVSAGEALPPDIFRRWQALTSLLILDGIGSTELLHIFISNRLEDYKPGASGRAVPGYELQIVDEKRCPGRAGRGRSPAGQRRLGGTLLLEQPGKNGGGRCAASGSTPATPICRMTRAITSTADGSDDMLKSRRHLVFPGGDREPPRRAPQSPRSRGSSAVPMTTTSPSPKAHVVLHDAGDASDAMANELLAHCQDGLARYKYPRWIHFVDELPKTATGKIQRFQLRKRG